VQYIAVDTVIKGKPEVQSICGSH